MKPDLNTKRIFILSQSGCILPFLIFFNLIFGWIFLGFFWWFISEAFLVLFFILTSYLTLRKIRRPARDAKIIDIKGEVLGKEE